MFLCWRRAPSASESIGRIQRFLTELNAKHGARVRGSDSRGQASLLKRNARERVNAATDKADDADSKCDTHIFLEGFCSTGKPAEARWLASCSLAYGDYLNMSSQVCSRWLLMFPRNQRKGLYQVNGFIPQIF